jgi:hypothetical protein
MGRALRLHFSFLFFHTTAVAYSYSLPCRHAGSCCSSWQARAQAAKCLSITRDHHPVEGYALPGCSELCGSCTGDQVVSGEGTPLGSALDAWSLGCILAELALHRPLFACHSPLQLLKQVRCRL